MLEFQIYIQRMECTGNSGSEIVVMTSKCPSRLSATEAQFNIHNGKCQPGGLITLLLLLIFTPRFLFMRTSLWMFYCVSHGNFFQTFWKLEACMCNRLDVLANIIQKF